MLTVRVGQEHINWGAPRSGTRCPIALAIVDQGVKRTKVVFVWQRIIFANGRFYVASRNATRFIRRFDDGKPVLPTTFRFKERV